MTVIRDTASRTIDPSAFQSSISMIPRRAPDGGPLPRPLPGRSVLPIDRNGPLAFDDVDRARRPVPVQANLVLIPSVDLVVFPIAIRDAPTVLSKVEFASAVQGLVHGACRNGVDVRGSWSFRTETDLPDFELELLEVAKPI